VGELSFEDKVKIIRANYKALDRREMERVREDWHPEIEWHDFPEVPDGDVHRGREAAAKALQAYLDVTPAAQIHPRQFTEAGDQVLVEWELRGSGAASEIPLQFTVFHLALIDSDGKLVRLRQFLTREAAMEAAGLKD
jgi:ketosteroid isomerase-like protein